MTLLQYPSCLIWQSEHVHVQPNSRFVQDTTGRRGSDLAMDHLAPNSGFAHRAFVANNVKEHLQTAANMQKATDTAQLLRKRLQEVTVATSSTMSMMDNAAEDCILLPNLQSGEFPCLQSPSPGYMEHATQLSASIHKHLARQPPDSPSAFYARLVNAERVVLSGSPILSCQSLKQYELRSQLAGTLAGFCQRAVGTCHAAYSQLRQRVNQQVGTLPFCINCTLHV